MQTEQYPWIQSRRFNAYADYFKEVFGIRVQKLSLDAGFTCPNRDGSKSTGGCTFCFNKAFNPAYCDPRKSITEQLEEGKVFHAWRYRRANSYLAYFQAYSNTYADLSVLKAKYEEALSVEGVVGLVIGSRPDCVDEALVLYLKELSKTYFIQLELGIESCWDKSLYKINRGHDFAATRQAFALLDKHEIRSGGHIILGLPGEDRESMLAQAALISELKPDSLKIHQLQIIKGTAMEKDYAANPEEYSFFSVEGYIEFVIDFIERLDPDILLERFAAEAPPRYRCGPDFGNIRSEQILLRIEQRLQERETWQGRLFNV